MKRQKFDDNGEIRTVWFFSHDEWNRISSVSDLAGVVAGITGLFLPVAGLAAVVGSPYFLLAKHLERKWGENGIIFAMTARPRVRHGSSIIPSMENPKNWSNYTGTGWRSC